MFKGFKIAAVCVAKLYEDQWRDFIDAFNREMTGHGWRVFIYTTDSDLYFHTRSDNGESYIFDLINYDITDAVLVIENSIFDTDVKDKIYNNCHEHGIPTFTIDNARDKSISIRFNYEAGFEDVVRHLTDVHGVTDIQMIAGNKGSVFSEGRIDIVRKVAAEKNIPFEDSRISYGDFWSLPAIAAAEKIIASGHLPQAIICANDVMAISVCETLNAHGIKIPDDIIVTGFDGIKEIMKRKTRIKKHSPSGCVLFSLFFGNPFITEEEEG